MATVIVRRIVASPVRSASDVWKVIVALLAESGSDAHSELLGVTGVASSLIASEAMQDAPIVVHGCGSRVRIYCLYGEAAITGDNANETNLAFDPTAGDWKLSLPCPEEDLSWVQAALKKSSRITARDITTTVDTTESKDVDATAVIDLESFLRS